MNTQNNEALLLVHDTAQGKMVDARLLHKQLEVPSHFRNWISRRINDFGFEKNKDFFEVSKNSFYRSKMSGKKNSNLIALFPLKKDKRGGTLRVDYRLTLDMAKELAMVERSERGRQVRRYFIEVERLARAAYEAGMVGNSTLLRIPPSVKVREINGRRLVPYSAFLRAIGKPTINGSDYKKREVYPTYFVELDKMVHVTEELALQIMLTRRVYKKRKELKQMEPVLALDFGDVKQLEQTKKQGGLLWQ